MINKRIDVKVFLTTDAKQNDYGETNKFWRLKFEV